MIAARPRLGNYQIIDDLVSRPGVLATGHYQLLGGAHTDTFVAFSQVARDPAALETIAGLAFGVIAPWAPTTVLAPSTAGVSLAGTVARMLSARLRLAGLDELGRPCAVIGEDIEPGARVLLVNDVVTTGAGLEALADVARHAGGEVVGATWFLSRSHVDLSERLKVPTVHTVDLFLEGWATTMCPLCGDHMPMEHAIDLN